MPSLVQRNDTGVFTGNTTGIGSGVSAQILSNNTGLGHCVVLLLQSLSTSVNSITAVTSAMGTFVRVNSYAYPTLPAEDEIWVCLNTTGASKNVAVTCPGSNAWQGCALEFDTPANGALDGGGNYQANANPETITVLPLAAGNLVVVFQDSLNNFTSPSQPPWTVFASGVYFNTVTNGTSALWQFASSTASVSASFPTGAGDAVTSAVVVQYASAVVQPSITAQRLPF